MTLNRRPPLAGRITATMCVIVCLTIVALDFFLSRLTPLFVVGPSLWIMVGVCTTSLWLSILPPRNRAIAFLPATIALAASAFPMFRRAREFSDIEPLAQAFRQAGSGYIAALALLLIGMAVLAR